MRKTSAALLLSLLCVFGSGANAQTGTYPNQTIKVLVGFAAGGPADVMAQFACRVQGVFDSGS